MKTFEEAYKAAEEWVKKLHEIDEKIKNWDFDLSKIKECKNKYKHRKRNWKKRMRELVYKSFPPDDYHNRDLHKFD